MLQSPLHNNQLLAKKFVDCALQHPDNNALFINNTFYTYKQLFDIASEIYLKIPTDKIYSRIGIYCNDDVYTYASLIAVNLYGAAYVPLNNKFPVSRNKNIVVQCDLKLILSSVANEDVKTIAGDTVIALSNTAQRQSISLEQVYDSIKKNIEKLKKVSQPICYILFTSGSTGEPKGVPVSHSNINHLFNFFITNYDFNSEDKFLQAFELTFDVSVFTFFMPLFVGACCYVPPNEGVKFVNILKLLKEHQITVATLVPALLNYAENYLNEIDLPHLRYSFFTAEALHHNQAVKWKKSLPNTLIYNFYGPTEGAIFCTNYFWDETISEKELVNGIVAIGKPLDSMKILILDEDNNPAKKGELCISGAQVFSGYLNEVTTNKFLIYKVERYYKTGDIVTLNALGNLLFHGRTDSQVKINGYRVELAEIEFAIEKITNAKCVSLCMKNAMKINQLIVFIETNQLNEVDFKQKLSSHLPDYMLPHQIIAIKKFPLNANGKVDRKKLLNLQK